MARPGLLKKVYFSDPNLDRFQNNVDDALDVVTADHDVLSSPVLSLAATTSIPPGRSVVVWRGNSGGTLTLPPASAQGPSVSALVVLANASSVGVTVLAAGTDSLVGLSGLVVAPGQAVFLVSDGISRWVTAGDADQEMDLRLISLRV